MAVFLVSVPGKVVADLVFLISSDAYLAPMKLAI